MKVSGMTHLVDDQGAARSGGIRPAFNAGSEHEVVKHQLPPPFEQVSQVRWSTRTGEDVVFLDPIHWLTAPLRRARESPPSLSRGVRRKPPATRPPRRSGARESDYRISYLSPHLTVSSFSA